MFRTLAIFALASAALAQSPTLIRQVKPVYPPAAKEAQISGLVRLEVDISPAGRVADIRPLSGHPLLVEAATEAVKLWEYEPIIVDGQAVQARAQVDVNFDLAGFPKTGAAMHVRGSEQLMKLVAKAKPVYPVEARQQGVAGRVRLQVLISKTGEVAGVRVLDGNPALVGAAVEAVKQWKYEPTALEGEPVEVVTDIDVNFVLPAVQQG